MQRHRYSGAVTELRVSNGPPASPSPFPPSQGGGNRRDGAECCIAYAGINSRKPMADVRQIAATDKQADALVYDWSDSGKCRPTAQLYGLTEDEIRIVGAGEK